MYEKFNWEFNNEVTKIFDDHVRKSVPWYDEFHKNIANISVYYSQTNSNIIDIGTSTGTLINIIREYNLNRKINYIGIDIQECMILECKRKYEGINFISEDALFYEYTNSSIITCMLSLQFLNKIDRIKLLNKIYDGLNNEGALFIVEKIKTNIVDIHDIYNDIYYDFKRNSLSDTEILDKNCSLRGVMKPLTLEENLNILKDIGFKKVDIFMKYNNFVGIVAIKDVMSHG